MTRSLFILLFLLAAPVAQAVHSQHSGHHAGMHDRADMRAMDHTHGVDAGIKAMDSVEDARKTAPCVTEKVSDIPMSGHGSCLGCCPGESGQTAAFQLPRTSLLLPTMSSAIALEVPESRPVQDPLPDPPGWPGTSFSQVLRL